MNYRLILRQDAERDLDQAYNWYNEKVPGLGSDFLVVVERALESIQANPARFPIVYRKVHRALLRRFPYGVFFVTDGDQIAVLAVMHTARDPDKWRQP
jgi:toxin ParE1/3/4